MSYNINNAVLLYFVAREIKKKEFLIYNFESFF